MRCTACTKTLPEGTAFCAYCGTRGAVSTAAIPSVPSLSHRASPAPQGGWPLWAIIGVSAVLFLIAFLIAYLIATGIG